MHEFQRKNLVDERVVGAIDDTHSALSDFAVDDVPIGYARAGLEVDGLGPVARTGIRRDAQRIPTSKADPFASLDGRGDHDFEAALGADNLNHRFEFLSQGKFVDP